MCREIAKRHPNELKYFKRNPKDLIFKEKFKRFTYDEILKEAKKKFPGLRFGSDLGEKEEREITRDFKAPVIVTHYPASLKPFYHRPDPENPKVVLCNDILAPEGYGEIIGSGERCWKLEELEQRMKTENLNPKDYEWYLDLRRYGSIPHSGFGLGMGRMLSWILRLPSIRDAVPYPRTMNRYYP
jgi:asparaginyl-tRNA synthetase